MSLSKKILRERKSGIGGSDCAAIMGLSKWRTPLDVYLDKIDKDIPYNAQESEAFYFGNLLEPVVIKEYEKRSKNTCSKLKDTIKNNKHPWLLANIDALVEDKKIIVEAKTTRYFSDDWGYDGGDKIPQEYLIQVAHYCLVLDYDVAHIAVLGATNDFRIYVYNRSKELEKLIIEKTKRFWEENVLKNIPPSVSSVEDINKLFRKEKIDSKITASDEIINLIEKHTELDSTQSLIEEELEIIKGKIKLYMGENALLTGNDGSKLFSWKNQITNRVNTKLLKLNNPELHKSLIEAKESRVFRSFI